MKIKRKIEMELKSIHIPGRFRKIKKVIPVTPKKAYALTQMGFRNWTASCIHEDQSKAYLVHALGFDTGFEFTREAAPPTSEDIYRLAFGDKYFEFDNNIDYEFEPEMKRLAREFIATNDEKAIIEKACNLCKKNKPERFEEVDWQRILACIAWSCNESRFTDESPWDRFWSDWHFLSDRTGAERLDVTEEEFNQGLKVLTDNGFVVNHVPHAERVPYKRARRDGRPRKFVLYF